MPVRSLPPPAKKRKIEQSAIARSIQEHEDKTTAAISNNSSLNSLADLVDLAQETSDPQDTSKAIYALYRVFVIIITNGKLSLGGGDDNTKAVKAWLWERLNIYVDFLTELLQDEEKALRVSSLQILLSLQKHLSSSASQTSSPPTPQFHVSHFKKIVSALLLCPPSKRRVDGRDDQSNASSTGKLDSDVLSLFHETWFSVHDDIRWFFLREAGTILSTISLNEQPYVPVNLLSILEGLTTFPTEPSELNSWWVPELGQKPPKTKKASKGNSQESDEDDDEGAGLGEQEDAEDDWRKFFDEPEAKSSGASSNKSKGPLGRIHTLTIHQSLHNLPSHRAVFTRAWLNLLPKLTVPNDLEMTKSLAIRALNVMHRGVMPHLTRPVLVMDWVGACVDFGGAVGLLALNALFMLMKEYNLDYPSFYTRLYAFLDRDVLHLKHRARFFRMMDTFLSSTHLPSLLLASFIKRLARLSLNAPPTAIVMILPFTYNVLKRHPALMVMIHRDEDNSNDPFNSTETNPLLTEALSSSLWEIQSHRSHYHSSVSTLAKIFSEAFTKQAYSMEDFLDHTYATLFDTEANRKIKKEPALAIETGQPRPPLFSDSDQAGGDVVNELWTFG
ncbi:CBF-domain-containing protein [Dendrothele bispora CBS 962.96]|uniref:CBF-domain-containing protein n=1 Tax=Dendrothele bispora (strain CBS 962.96) TaxID=1314807 RepID=A0A4S8MR21_DENBC|nr:CBF-domain-containing protein [Dendrothele bispora CBS 962.96]